MKSYFFVLTRWWGGGVERVFENVANVILENDSDSRVFVFVLEGYDEDKYLLNTKIVLIKGIKNFVNCYYKNKDSFLVNFTGDWKSTLFCSLISRKVISWFHGNPYVLAKARTAFLNFYLLKKSLKLVCVCKEQKEILINKYNFNEKKLVVIYNSVNFQTVSQMSTERLEFQYKYLLMVARIDFSSKDFYTVIDAYSLLDKKIKDEYKLVFLGEGGDRTVVEEYIANKSLKDNIFLPGYDKNPYKWIKNAECVILSSKTEGFNVSVIETMYLGKPQIISNYHTGAFEVADNEKNILMFEVGNNEQLLEKILLILDNKNIRNSLIKNSQNFSNQFSNEFFSIHIKELFDANK